MRKVKLSGVSPVIATILLVAMTVVLVGLLYFLVANFMSGSAPPSSSLPLGLYSKLLYNNNVSVDIVSAPGTALVNDSKVQLLSPQGRIYSPSLVILYDPSSFPIANYTNGFWDVSGDSGYKIGQKLVINITTVVVTRGFEVQIVPGPFGGFALSSAIVQEL